MDQAAREKNMKRWRGHRRYGAHAVATLEDVEALCAALDVAEAMEAAAAEWQAARVLACEDGLVAEERTRRVVALGRAEAALVSALVARPVRPSLVLLKGGLA